MWDEKKVLAEENGCMYLLEKCPIIPLLEDDHMCKSTILKFEEE